MSKLTRASLLVAFFFGLDKIMAFARLMINSRVFGLSKEFDAFNAANNIPDLLFALISGGALAMAFIPVLTTTLTKEGRSPAWRLFSRIANLAFVATAVLAIVVALLAESLVRLGVAPGFGVQQQQLVVELMRLNLVATLIFSISGLVMAGLQANQHFLLPAMAPLLYNIGQIFGALILSPEKGFRFGPVTLPAFGLGIHGLVYGVIIGAVLHLAIQIPGLAKYQFHWAPSLGLKDEAVRRVLRLIGPRLGTMMFIQLVFIARDNLASHLSTGSVTLLTYGWMIMQVPETLVGTAIGIALLPTLSELVAREDKEAFQATLQRAMQVIVAITLPVGVVLMIGLGPLLKFAFGYDDAGTQTLLWVTRGFLVGLTAQCLNEIGVRSFYARQDAITPLMTAGINFGIYVVLGIVLSRWLGAPGLGLADALAFSSQAVLLLILLSNRLVKKLSPGPVLIRAVIAAIVGGGVVALLLALPLSSRQPLVMGMGALVLGGLAFLPLIWKELRLLLHL
jgi:putative peptidoglycan lipid II flippase